MTTLDERTRAVSDPNSPDYDPDSPHYDVTADSSSTFYVGPITGDHKSGDEIRNEVTSVIDQVTGPPGGFLDQLFGPFKDDLIQSSYQGRIEAERAGLADEMEMRAPGEAPRTMWENASHEQMAAVIGTNADSSAVAVTSEEWVRLGNDLSGHQKAFGAAIKDSLSNWEGEAGDSARRHLAEVAKWLGTTSEGAVLAGRQQEIHSQTLNETQKVMATNPPVPFSAAEANARLAGITNPVQFAMQFSAEMDTFNRSKAARDQAAQVMTRFDETIASAVTTPKFTAPPALPSATPMRSVRPMMAGERLDAVSRQLDDAAPAGTEGLRREALSASPNTFAAQTAVVPDLRGGAGGPGGQGAPGAGPVPDIPGGGVPGGGVPGGGVPGGGIPGGGVPGGGVPGGGGPGGSADLAARQSVPDIPGGGGTPGGGPIPGGGASPGGDGFGGGAGGQGRPAVPEIPQTSLSGGGVPGSTVSAGFTPNSPSATPNVPDIPRGATVPSGVPGGGGNLPGGGFGPTAFSGTSPAGRDTERTTRMPSPPNPRDRQSIPDIPGGARIPGSGPLDGGGGPRDGRGFGPGGVPNIPGGNAPGGGPLGVGKGGFGPGGGPGGVPNIPGGGSASGSSVGGAPGGAGAGRGGGFGPMGSGGPGGAGGTVGAMPGGVGPGGAAGGGGAAGARGGNAGGAPMGGMGGAGSQGAEDREYRFAEYLEGESELFAPDAVVHPPVIGDWQNKQDWK
ncbi:hypothetical protein [Actinophytocola xanthii]|uniref:PPE family domain-containing protein n=1 Tax=Actinophytocola xanthii TaxID=1912961 RepID=A0A1Q8CW17_9PSEU|nr:hypothetical protein [Actinophytocola xanthii]OLF18532.1 hypothetical protein BU204_06165 [Actinophytocola xanthii]